MVRLLQVSTPPGAVVCISHLDQAGLVSTVSRSRHHVELGRVGRICGGKGDLLGALGDVQAVLIAQLVLHTVGYDDALRVLADVEQTQPRAAPGSSGCQS